MEPVLLGVLLAAGSYLTFGFVIGVWIVATNLARFHGGGFQWKRMAKHIGKVMLLWPLALVI